MHANTHTHTGFYGHHDKVGCDVHHNEEGAHPCSHPLSAQVCAVRERERES